MGLYAVASGVALISLCSGVPLALANVNRRLKEARLRGIKEGTAAVMSGLKPFYERSPTSHSAVLTAEASFEETLQNATGADEQIELWQVHARHLGHVVGHILASR